MHLHYVQSIRKLLKHSSGKQAGYLPEAGFRRHAPRQMKRRWRWRCRGTAMWIVVSSVGTSISLTGQSGTSALLSPVALWQPPAQCVKGCNKHVKPGADSPLFSLPHRSCLDNWFICSLPPPPQLLWHSSCDSHRQLDFRVRNKTSSALLETS